MLSEEQTRGAARPAPSGSPSPSGTPVPARSSSSTTPAGSTSPSSRSTPGSRSSTPSPRSPPTPTWSSCRSTSRPAAGSRATRRSSAATPSRPASTPRTPTATSPPPRAGSRCSTLPAGPGIRVDTGVGEGDTIPADFDSMIAKIIAYGRNRDEALGRLRRAVAETTVVIEGGATNKSFILDLLDQPEVIDGSADTGWIDRVRGEGRLVARHHSGIALVAAGIEAYEDEEQVEVTRLLETARGRPTAGPAQGRPRGRPQAAWGRAQGPRHAHRAAPVPGRPSTTTSPLDASLERIDEYCEPAHRRGLALPPHHRHATGRSISSRSTERRTGSAATRAASCGPRPPHWSSRRRRPSAARSRPVHPSSFSRA